MKLKKGADYFYTYDCHKWDYNDKILEVVVICNV